MTVTTYVAVVSSRCHGRVRKSEFWMTPASARGCSDWMNSARRPARARIGSPCTFQVTDDGPNNPRSATLPRLPAG
jgi:hypothetical protein